MKILQLMGTLDRGGVESMIVNLIRNGLKTDICLEIPDVGMLEKELRSYEKTPPGISGNCKEL